MENYIPPFTLNDDITNLVGKICEEVGKISVISQGLLNPRLRKSNRIRTIHSSLAIEHNSLSLEQVTAIVNGKRILGNPNEIKEVQNAYTAYDNLFSFNPYATQDLLKAHQYMMQGLISECGVFRLGGVGVFKGKHLVHMAPPAHLVPSHMDALLMWYKHSAMHPLIKSAIFHYEFEFIHPFSDGNGRMGRMWHTLLLGQWKPLFFWLPMEEVIKDRQKDYYAALRQADQQANSTPFVQFMLSIILSALQNLSVVGENENAMPLSPSVQKLLHALGEDTLTAVQLMAKLGLEHKPTFRKNYLNPALQMGVVKMTLPNTPKSKNQSYYATHHSRSKRP